MGSYLQNEPTSHDHSTSVLYSIKKSEYVGRYMVAARDIQPGEAIFMDQPACIGESQSANYYLVSLTRFVLNRSGQLVQAVVSRMLQEGVWQVQVPPVQLAHVSTRLYHLPLPRR
jgi:hypothetical protein